MKTENGRFDQLGSIFSQFSEENKDILIETAQKLLKAQEGTSPGGSGATDGSVAPENNNRNRAYSGHGCKGDLS